MINLWLNIECRLPLIPIRGRISYQETLMNNDVYYQREGIEINNNGINYRMGFDMHRFMLSPYMEKAYK